MADVIGLKHITVDSSEFRENCRVFERLWYKSYVSRWAIKFDVWHQRPGDYTGVLYPALETSILNLEFRNMVALCAHIQ